MEAGAPVACVHTLDSEADMSIVTRRRMSNIDYMTWGDFQRMRKEYFNANKRLIFIGENKEEQGKSESTWISTINSQST
jgi:hypothetical protein